MKFIKLLKYLYIDSICYFISMFSSFMSLALTETDSGKFLVAPLLLSATTSSIILIFIHCFEKEEPTYPDSLYDIL